MLLRDCKQILKFFHKFHHYLRVEIGQKISKYLTKQYVVLQCPLPAIKTQTWINNFSRTFS